MSYIAFIALFLIAPILITGMLVIRRVQRGEIPSPIARRGLYGTLALAAIALVYTTPWDNVMVERGIWGYDPHRVLGIIIGWVPLEEYLFFMLQPILIGIWGLLSWTSIRESPIVPSAGLRWGAGLILGGAWAVLLAMENRFGPPWTYCRAILAWGLPPLILQIGFGADLLWGDRRSLLLRWIPPAFFLSAADRLAIAEGIWFLNPDLTTGLTVLGLPVEEGLFFFLTSLLVAGGWTLWMHPAAQHRLLIRKPRRIAGRTRA